MKKEICIHPKYRPYHKAQMWDLSVATIDPLGLNQFFSTDFPLFSEEGRIEDIKTVMTETFNRIGYKKISTFDTATSAAAIRDLSMFTSSLNRWGFDISRCSELTHWLMELSAITQEVPVDTVYSYGPRNPTGKFMRRFTTSEEELIFINSFVAGMSALYKVVAGLEILQEISPCNPEYDQIAQESAESFSKMVSSIILVKKQISPEVFTGTLRPFFEPKTIADTKYYAPGGAQMPICLIDLLLWGVGRNQTLYTEYQAETIKYLPVFWKVKFSQLSTRDSIVDTLEKRVGVINDENGINFNNSVNSIIMVLTQMERFRRPHLKIAKDNMAIRPQGSVGSGGYDVTVLEYLLDETTLARERLLNLITSLKEA